VRVKKSILGIKEGGRSKKSEGRGGFEATYKKKREKMRRFIWKSEMCVYTQKGAVLRQKMTDPNR